MTAPDNGEELERRLRARATNERAWMNDPIHKCPADIAEACRIDAELDEASADFIARHREAEPVAWRITWLPGSPNSTGRPGITDNKELADARHLQGAFVTPLYEHARHREGEKEMRALADRWEAIANDASSKDDRPTEIWIADHGYADGLRTAADELRRALPLSKGSDTP